MGMKWQIAKNATRLAIVAGALKYCSDKAIFTCDSKHGAQMFHTAHKRILPGIKFYREQLPHRDDAAEALEENWNGCEVVAQLSLPQLEIDQWMHMSVLIETTIGPIVVDLFVTGRPRCSLNFIKLCKLKYYNFSCFHSIEEGYIAQTGDPTGSGRGGNSVFCEMYGEQAKYFEAEMVPKLKHTRRGLVSMVNNGADAHGSQFFFTLADDLDYLDASKHTVFGQVSEGFETLDRLNEALCDEQHRPYQDIRLCHTLILWDPFDDPPGFVVPERSPSPTVELLKSMRLGVDEDLLDDGTGGKSGHEVEEMIAKKEAVARAHILEMIGDLHHAEERPPDNVLFVCKLNPVTCEEDLEIIFSRFGKIESAEVIRDKVSGNSLQYAFIEFETPEMCEAAYFKMDNVLIDDRRIHVDFSQSVSKNPKYVWQKLLDREKKKGGVASENNASKVDGKRKVESGHREKHTDRHSTVKQSKRNNRSSPENRNSDRDKDRRKRSRSRDRIGAVPIRKKYRSRSPRDRRDYRGDRRDFRERDRDRRR